MSHLGEALISDELVAWLGLIKNSYDADANRSIINIDTNFINEYGQGKTEIFDDGNGMS
jgi:DNA mismatch repair ATPase MutL